MVRKFAQTGKSLYLCSAKNGGEPPKTESLLHNIRENSSVGRAQPCQGWGRGFESRFSLSFNPRISQDTHTHVRVVELVDTLL